MTLKSLASALYTYGNIGPNRTLETRDEAVPKPCVFDRGKSGVVSPAIAYDTGYEPMPKTTMTITIVTAEYLRNLVITRQIK